MEEMKQLSPFTLLESIIDRLETVSGRISSLSWNIQNKLLWEATNPSEWCWTNPSWLIERANRVITSLEGSKELLSWLLESVI